MAYTPQTWADGSGGGTPISAARLNNIESGIAAAASTADAAASARITANVRDYGAAGNGTTDDTSAVQAAISALDSTNGGVVWFPPGRYAITTVNITGKRVTLDGPGVLLNGTVNVGAQSGYAPIDMYTRIRVGFDRTAKSGTVNAINIGNSHNVEIGPLSVANYRALANFPSLALGTTNQQHSARIRVTGVTTPSWPSGTGGWPDYLVYVGANSTGGAYSIGDLTVVDNPNASVRIGHIVGAGVDGLVCAGNTFFFPNYQALDATKTRHVDLTGSAGFIQITGNQLFESGFESVRLNGVPTNITITGNHFAWSGQRDLSDAVAITTSNSGDLRGTITGNNFELYTKAAVGFYGNGNAAGVVIGQNATYTDNPNFSYYGATTLPASGSFKRYTSATTLTGQPRIGDGAGQHYTWTDQDQIGAITADSQQRLGPVAGLTSVDKFANVTAANTAIVLASGIRGSATLFGGQIVVYAEDGGATRTASYILNVAGTSTGRTVTQVSAAGETTGAVAAAPSFTWSFNSGGFLCATPVGSTTGTFHFSMTAIGNVAISW